MFRKYYVTLCGEDYFLNYVTVYAENREEAFGIADKEYGFFNVSSVYTEKAWQNKFTQTYSHLGELENKRRLEYLRSKRIV